RGAARAARRRTRNGARGEQAPGTRANSRHRDARSGSPARRRGILTGAQSMATQIVLVALVITVCYTVLLGLYGLVMLAVAVRESVFRRRQDRVEDYDVMLGSRYTIPVSVIAPAFNEELMAV